ncbi:hypothetical protein BC835DRAFT_1412686 [Cytidiella melzeri]|nr:hypothetical protein BC835DRAFT_1412686 [Cytidiella melzeri]
MDTAPTLGPATRPQCTRIITGPSLLSALPNPEAAFSLRDTLVHNFELALRRQGSLSASGKMSEPFRPTVLSSDLPQRIAGSSLPRESNMEQRSEECAQPRKPATPSLCNSSTSPFTLCSPNTPSYESYTSSTYTSPIIRPSPTTRSRSGSHASTYTFPISPSPTLRHNPVVLPIGQKVPKWREAMSFSEVDEHHETRLMQQTGAGFTRPTRRTPMGPRPMLRTSSSGSSGMLAIGLGLGLPVGSHITTLEEKLDSAIAALDSRANRERRRGIGFNPQPQQSPVHSHQEDDFDADYHHWQHSADRSAETIGDNESPPFSGVLREDEHSDSFYDDDEHSSSVSGTQDGEDGDDDHDESTPPTSADVCPAPPYPASPSPIDTHLSPLPILSLRIPVRHPAHPVSPKSPIALPTLTVLIPNRGLPLNPLRPLEADRSIANDESLSLAEGGERSAFDSDSESDSEEWTDDKRKAGRTSFVNGIGRIRRVIRSTVSLESVANLKGRLSLIGPSTSLTSSLIEPAVTSSPESVASLRARQITTSSSIFGSGLYHQRPSKTGGTSLSPIPATPMDLLPPHTLEDDEAALASPCSLPTPVTPAVERTKSFIQHMTYTPVSVVDPPPVPMLPSFMLLQPTVNGVTRTLPPNLPLPPTPLVEMELSLSAVRRQPRLSSLDIDAWRAQVQTEEENHRLTVVDPDESMALLERSIAKLEAYAPSFGSAGSASPPQLIRDSDSSLHGDDEEEDEVLMLDGTRGQAGTGRTPPLKAAISIDSAGTGETNAMLLPCVDEAQAPPPLPTTTTSEVMKSTSRAVKPPVPPKGPDVVVRLLKPPSKEASALALPKFDFESPGHRVLDLRGTALRSESRLESRLDFYPEDVLEDAAADQDDALECTERRGRAGILQAGDENAEALKHPTCLPPQVITCSDESTVSFGSGMSSFVDVCPQSQKKRSRSKVRKLLDRVRDRTESIRIPALPPFNIAQHLTTRSVN